MKKVTQEQLNELYEKTAEQYALVQCEGYSYDPWKEIKTEEGGLFQFVVSEEVMLGLKKVQAITPECARSLGKFQNKHLLEDHCKRVRFSIPREVEANAKKIIEGKAVKWPRVYTYVERVVPTSVLPASVPLNEGRIDVGFSYEGDVPYTLLDINSIYSIRKDGIMTFPLRIRLGGKVNGTVSFQVEEVHYDMQDLMIMVGKKLYRLRAYVYNKKFSLLAPTEHRIIEGDESTLDVIFQIKFF